MLEMSYTTVSKHSDNFLFPYFFSLHPNFLFTSNQLCPAKGLHELTLYILVLPYILIRLYCSSVLLSCSALKGSSWVCLAEDRNMIRTSPDEAAVSNRAGRSSTVSNTGPRWLIWERIEDYVQYFKLTLDN